MSADRKRKAMDKNTPHAERTTEQRDIPVSKADPTSRDEARTPADGKQRIETAAPGIADLGRPAGLTQHDMFLDERNDAHEFSWNVQLVTVGWLP